MPETFLYLTTVGHISGNFHDIEIWYVDNYDRYYLCAEKREKTHWVQNILANPKVAFSVGTRDAHEALVPYTDGKARILDQAKEPSLFHVVTQLFNGKYGWSNGLLVEVVSTEVNDDDE